MTNKFMTDLIRILSFALIAVILFSAAGGLGTRAYAEEDSSSTEDSQNASASYAPVNVDAKCSLTVYPCGNTSDAFDDLKNNASMTVDLYKIASAVAISGVDSYDYSLESDFSSLSSLLAEARKVNGSSNWEALTQEAAKIAKVKSESLSNTGTKDKEAESVEISGLDTGLYLLIPHTDAEGYWEGSDPLVTRVYSDTANYYYLPMLISLPHKRDVIPTVGTVMTSDKQRWQYQLSVYLKPECEKMADAEILVSKSLVGREWQEGDSFTFTLSAIDGAPMPENSEVTVTSPEPVSFGSVRYARAGTYSYTIVEQAPEKPNNITYDTSEHNVVVTVEKGDDNNLKAEVKYDESDSLTITNIYKSDGVIKLEALKTFRGAILLKGAFTFDLLDENGELIERVGNEVGGRIAFSPITVDGSIFDGGKESVVLTYTVKENVPFILFRVPGVTYDTRPYTATVILTDKGDGTIDTSVIWTLNGRAVPKAEFVNTYSRNPKTGDSQQLIWQSALMVLAILVAVTTLILVLRKRRGRK